MKNKKMSCALAAFVVSGVAFGLYGNIKEPKDLAMLNVEALSVMESNPYTKYKAKKVYTYMKYRQEFDSETNQYKQVPDCLWMRTDCIGYKEGVVECYQYEGPAPTDENENNKEN